MDSQAVRDEPTFVTMKVPFAASSVTQVRRVFETWLAGREASPERVEDARVVISELVGNAVRHAQPMSDGCLLVVWGIDRGKLTISVSDGGSTTTPHRVDASVSATSGRGMAIVSTLVDRWWLENADAQSTVHAELVLTQ